MPQNNGSNLKTKNKNDEKDKNHQNTLSILPFYFRD